MGADMLVYAIWIGEDQNPDWNGAEEAVKALRWGEGGKGLPLYAADGSTFIALEGQHEDGPEAEAALQEFVRTHLDLVRRGVDNLGSREGLREMGATSHMGWMVYITGGLSWGDRPTELSESFDVLNELEILEAAGFNGESNAVSLSLPSDHESRDMEARAAELLKPEGAYLWHSGGGIMIGRLDLTMRDREIYVTESDERAGFYLVGIYDHDESGDTHEASELFDSLTEQEMLEKVREYVLEAAVHLAKGLMRGDKATFKAGYTLPNALIAASEMFPTLTTEAIGDALTSAEDGSETK